MNFKRYDIIDELKANLEKGGYKKPTDIQYKALPSIMRGEDVLAIAQTGTGKTAAFVIPIIDRIHRGKKKRSSAGIACIVMVPTRELARQIGEVFNQLGKNTHVVSFALYGGVEQERQIVRLQKGIDVLITTPGRMFDLINQKHILVDTVHTFVLDEADRMLREGFYEDLQYIKKMLVRRHQTLFFSATIDPEIKKLAFSQVKSTAIRIQISPEDPVTKNVKQMLLFVEMDDKRRVLEFFLKEEPQSCVIVFVRTKVRAERVALAMERVGIETLTLHSDKEQSQREAVLESFRSHTCRVMIATDLSARGIDIPGVTHVINYDLPTNPENYVHRVGRTGRGMAKGESLTFCSEEEKTILEEIEKFMGKKIPVISLDGDSRRVVQSCGESEQKAIEQLIMEEEMWQKSKKKRSKRS